MAFVQNVVPSGAERLFVCSMAAKSDAVGRVEIEDNTGMPEGVPRMIAIGFTLIFLILIVMCPSFVEALLFMLTIGLAILILSSFIPQLI